MQSAPSKPSRRRTGQRHQQQVEVGIAMIPADVQNANLPESADPAEIAAGTQESSSPRAIDAGWDAATRYLVGTMSMGQDGFSSWIPATQSGLHVALDLQNTAILIALDLADVTTQVCLGWFDLAAASVVQFQAAVSSLAAIGFETGKRTWSAPNTAG